MEPNRGFWTGLRVCVTGGTGFLGYHIVQQLRELGARVRILALPCLRPHPLQDQPDVVSVFGDIRDRDLVRQVLANCDVIFHTAGVVATWGPALRSMYSVHLTGTRHVLQAAPRHARVIHTSSIVAMGASPTAEPLTEESTFNLNDLQVDYVHAKRASEDLALEAAAQGQQVVVTNPGYLVGPDDHGRSALGQICLRFWKGRMPLASPGGLNLVDVRDVARGHLLAAEHGQPGRRYILGGANMQFHEFLALLAAVAGMKPRALPVLPRWVMRPLAGFSHCCSWLTHAEPYPSMQHVRLTRFHWFCRSDRAERELGYHTRNLDLCLDDTYRWFTSQNKMRLRGLNRWWMQPGPSCGQAA